MTIKCVHLRSAIKRINKFGQIDLGIATVIEN